MSNPRKIYWDSSCFICFLNADEVDRSHICDDVLRNAEAGAVEIWISTWVIVEVIRPRRPGNEPLPNWAQKVFEKFPETRIEIEELWRRNQRNKPTPKLTPNEIQQIQGMFEWDFLKKAEVNEQIALKAVDYCREFSMKPADAVHAATAIHWKCDVIQRWDRDFSKVAHLIASEEPKRMSAQGELTHTNKFGPNSEDNIHDQTETPETQPESKSAELSGGSNRPAEDQAGDKKEKREGA